MERTNLTRYQIPLRLLVLACVTMTASGPIAVAAAQGADDADQAPGRVGLVELRVEVPGSVTTESLTSTWQAFLEQWQRDLDTIVGATPDVPLVIRFVGDPAATASDDMVAVSDASRLNADASVAAVDLDVLLSWSDTEVQNEFRYLLARRWLAGTSGASMPPALADGFARYLETPVLAQQARQASLAQQAYLDGELPSWDGIMTLSDRAQALDPEASKAARMALAAFLVERYGANVISELATAFGGDPDGDPVAIVSEITGQPAERLDAGWEDFIAAWFGGGWRNNAFAALDLEPARDLFARGAYEAAADRANRTLQVTTALDDRVASAEAEMIVAQASVGMQAEALMTDAEEALRAHDYARAQTLIDRAEDQYALLPEDHRPSSLIESWRETTATGLGAVEDVTAASANYDDWFAMRGARQDAVSAGTAFAALGDADRLAVAQQLVDDLDARFLRLVIALGSAILLLVGWLLVWSWNRAPGRLRWRGVSSTILQGGAR